MAVLEDWIRTPWRVRVEAGKRVDEMAGEEAGGGLESDSENRARAKDGNGISRGNGEAVLNGRVEVAGSKFYLSDVTGGAELEDSCAGGMIISGACGGKGDGERALVDAGGGEGGLGPDEGSANLRSGLDGEDAGEAAGIGRRVKGAKETDTAGGTDIGGGGKGGAIWQCAGEGGGTGRGDLKEGVTGASPGGGWGRRNGDGEVAGNMRGHREKRGLKAEGVHGNSGVYFEDVAVLNDGEVDDGAQGRGG